MVVAVRDLAPGDLVLVDTPALVCRYSVHIYISTYLRIHVSTYLQVGHTAGPGDSEAGNSVVLTGEAVTRQQTAAFS